MNAKETRIVAGRKSKQTVRAGLIALIVPLFILGFSLSLEAQEKDDAQLHYEIEAGGPPLQIESDKGPVTISCRAPKPEVVNTTPKKCVIKTVTTYKRVTLNTRRHDPNTGYVYGPGTGSPNVVQIPETRYKVVDVDGNGAAIDGTHWGSYELAEKALAQARLSRICR